ncbi:MAG: hypothetical protein ACWGQW_21085 [bacterium]
MVHLYTRVSDFCDVIMRETKQQFEVELRHRSTILDPFQPGHGAHFSKEDENAERQATKEYNDLLEAVSKKE